MVSSGSFVGLRRGQVEVRRGGELVERVPLAEVERIVVWSGAAGVSVRLLVEAGRMGVPVVFVGRGPDAVSVVLPGVSGRSPFKMVAQAEWRASPEKRLRAARWFIEWKLRGRAWLLKRLSRSRAQELRDYGYLLEASARGLAGAGSVDRLRSEEAAAGRLYWEAVRRYGLLGEDFRGREPRAGDRWNSALDLLYALLRAEAQRALSIAGLYPYMGFMHADRSGRPSLALDFMEPYRWLAEWALFKAAGRGWEPRLGEGGRLSRDTVARLLEAWDRMLSSAYPGAERSVSKTIMLDAWKLGEALLEGWDWAPTPLGPW